MGHWYTRDAEPLHFIEKAKGGGTRDTTLRDARKLGLVPGVTGVIKMLAAPALTRWMVTEALKSAHANAELLYLPVEDYCRRVAAISQQQVADARDMGHVLHGACEMRTQDPESDVGEWTPHADAAMEALHNLTDDGFWEPELRFAHRMGFGGSSDVVNKPVRHVADYKAKDFDIENLPVAYDEHAMQLGAYIVGHGLIDADADMRQWAEVGGTNIFISRTVPGLVHPVTIPGPELFRGWHMFRACHRLWCLANNYDPSW